VVAGRAFAFADPTIIKLATDKFVPCTADDWYQRRRQDAEGEFFRAVADQPGGRKGTGGSTRQGIYCLTADGELLAYKNAGQDVASTREQLERALRKFAALPKSRTAPGAVDVAPLLKADPAFTRTPPAGGLVARVYTRILDAKDGGYVKGTCPVTGGDKAARDYLWLTAEEVAALVPKAATVGTTVPLLPALARRLTRFHLVDNTRGEPNFWEDAEVRSEAFTLTVASATADAVELRIDGEATLATDADPDKADRGYIVRVRGDLRYRPAAKAFDRFDIAAVGDHWGEGDFTKNGERPGRQPLGLMTELADPTVPADRVPPQAAREWRRYLGK
jgi:hypothetical protein